MKTFPLEEQELLQFQLLLMKAVRRRDWKHLLSNNAFETTFNGPRQENRGIPASPSLLIFYRHPKGISKTSQKYFETSKRHYRCKEVRLNFPIMPLRLILMALDKKMEEFQHALHRWYSKGNSKASQKYLDTSQGHFRCEDETLNFPIISLRILWIKVIIEKSRGEGSLMVQDTIENVS